MKRAFTLIEVLVATAILALVITLFSNLVMNYKKSADWFNAKTDSEASLALVSKILYTDLISASKIESIGDSKIQTIKIQTSHSLYGIQNPYVAWYVLKEKKTLVRAESAVSFDVPMNINNNKYTIFADNISTQCDKLLVYQANSAIFVSVIVKGDRALKFAVPSVIK